MTDTTASARVAMRKVPIIVVPGIAGTRLTDPAEDRLVWNPLGALPGEPGSFAADADRLSDVERALVPDTSHRFPRVPERVRVEPIRNYYNLIHGFYGSLSQALHYDLGRELAPRNIAPVVYCCGYDWRQSNATSALRLQAVADQAQRECDGEKIVIVAHSMGGVVAREFCKNLGGEARLRSLILLGSPTLGAIKAYRELREGFPFLDAVRRVLNLGANESRDFLRRLPAVYQLLPTHVYCSRVRRSFAEFDRKHTGLVTSASTPVAALQFSDNSNSALFYSDLYTGLRGDTTTRATVERNLGIAASFDARLTVGDLTYMPRESICYLCDDMSTPGRLRLVFEGVTGDGTLNVQSRLEEVDTLQGDETVPGDSANSPFLTNAFRIVRRFPGVDHVKLSSDSAVIERVLQDVVASLRIQ